MKSLAALTHQAGQQTTARMSNRAFKPVLLGVALSSMVAATVLGTGVAEAASSPNVVGQKYSDARGALSGAGYAIVVSNTIGDQVAWPDCIVTHQQDRSVPPPENTGASATNQTLLALNCDAQLASAKTPGNSLASPAGQAAAASAAAKAPADTAPGS